MKTMINPRLKQMLDTYFKRCDERITPLRNFEKVESKILLAYIFELERARKR